MRKVIVNEFLALDGTAQAPGGADEDTSGGFQHGGWHMQFGGASGAGSGVTKLIGEASGFLLGRRTYRDLRRLLAERARGRAGDRRSSEHEAEVRCVDDTHGPAGVAELERAVRGSPRCGCRTQGGRRRRPARGRQHRARAITDPARPRRRVPPHDRSDTGRRREADLPDDGALRPLRLVDHEVTSRGTIIATYAPGSQAGLRGCARQESNLRPLPPQGRQPAATLDDKRARTRSTMRVFGVLQRARRHGYTSRFRDVWATSGPRARRRFGQHRSAGLTPTPAQSTSRNAGIFTEKLLFAGL
jgi:hypothetical protein